MIARLLATADTILPAVRRPTLQDLEAAAISGHEAGMSWTEFWARHRLDVGQLEPISRERYQRLVRRLGHLLLTGDPAGQFAVGDDEPSAPWEADDRPEPARVVDDGRTAAMIDWTAAGLQPVAIGGNR